MTYVSRTGPYVPNLGNFDTLTELLATHPATLYNPGTTAYVAEQGIVVSNGSVWEDVGEGGSTALTAATYAAARLISGVTTGDRLEVLGRTTQSDGGQGLFTWVVGANIYGDNDLRLTSTGGYWQRQRYDGVFAQANPVGINFAAGGGVALSYELFPIFRNRVRESRGFTTTAFSNIQVALSTAGWPTVDFSCLLQEGNAPPSWATGTFACGFLTTSGTETIAGVSATVTNIIRGIAGTYTTFDLTPTGANAFGFTITGTSGTTTNIFAFLPAYRSFAPAASTSGPIDDPTTAAAFTKEAILHYSQYAHLRLMKWSFAEANLQVSTSATRRTPTNTQANQGFNNTGIVLTAPPGNGATSATLTAVWPMVTGSYGLAMHSPTLINGRICTCTKGSTSVTWSAALTEACDASYLVGSQGTEGYPIEWMVAFCNACNIGIWINTPMLEDGINSSAGSWSAAVMDYLVTHWTSSGKVYFEIANEIWNGASAPRFVLGGVAKVNGFADVYGYIAYLLHAFANLCRTKFPTTFGTKVYQVLGWQTIGLDAVRQVLADLALLGTVNADIQYLSIAPYVTPTIGNTDSIATIEAAVTTAGATQALVSRCESNAVFALKYGIGLCSYESGGQWGAVNQSNANVGLAIMDAGMTAALTAYHQGIFNSGLGFITHFGSGVSGTAGNTSPTYGLSNIYASPLSSSTLASLQSFMAGATVTRNVVGGSGSVISAVNYVDNSAAIVNSPGNFNSPGFTYPPYWTLGGYLPYLINCTAPGTYALTVNFTVSSGTPTTDLEVNGEVLSTGTSVVTGNVALGNVTLKAGVNYVLLGKSGSQAGVAVNSLTFT